MRRGGGERGGNARRRVGSLDPRVWLQFAFFFDFGGVDGGLMMMRNLGVEWR